MLEAQQQQPSRPFVLNKRAGGQEWSPPPQHKRVAGPSSLAYAAAAVVIFVGHRLDQQEELYSWPSLKLLFFFFQKFSFFSPECPLYAHVDVYTYIYIPPPDDHFGKSVTSQLGSSAQREGAAAIFLSHGAAYKLERNDETG